MNWAWIIFSSMVHTANIQINCLVYLTST